MADRCTLHWNHLDDFRAWLTEHGWHILKSPPGNGFEVLRVKHPDQRHPVIFYSRLAKSDADRTRDVDLPPASAQALYAKNRTQGMAQHLTSHGRGPALVRAFLNDRRRRKSMLTPAPAPITTSAVAQLAGAVEVVVRNGAGEMLQEIDRRELSPATQRRIARGIAAYQSAAPPLPPAIAAATYSDTNWGPCACGEIAIMAGSTTTETGVHTLRECSPHEKACLSEGEPA